MASGIVKLSLQSVGSAARFVRTGNVTRDLKELGQNAIEATLNDAWLSAPCPIRLPAPSNSDWYLDDSQAQGQVTIDLLNSDPDEITEMGPCWKTLTLELDLERLAHNETSCDGSPANTGGEDAQPLVETDT